MENKRENKKFYKKLMIVLLSAWLFMLIIPLNTILYDKETYVYEPQNYGFKNLANPILENKEYLGDGLYRLYDNNGITIDYNVYNGIYAINGTITDSIAIDIGSIITENGQNYTSTYRYISGQGIISTNWRLPNENLNSAVSLQDNIKTVVSQGQTTFHFFRSTIGQVYNNFMFKYQLEKGDTATAYEVPIEPLIYHYKGGIKNA